MHFQKSKTAFEYQQCTEEIKRGLFSLYFSLNFIPHLNRYKMTDKDENAEGVNPEGTTPPKEEESFLDKIGDVIDDIGESIDEAASDDLDENGEEKGFLDKVGDAADKIGDDISEATEDAPSVDEVADNTDAAVGETVEKLATVQAPDATSTEKLATDQAPDATPTEKLATVQAPDATSTEKFAKAQAPAAAAPQQQTYAPPQPPAPAGGAPMPQQGMQQPGMAPAPQGMPQPGMMPPPGYAAGMPPQKLENASTSKVMGIISIVLFFNIIGIVLAIVAIVMGSKAMKVFESNPGRYHPDEFKAAKTGRTCGIVSLCLFVGIILIVLIIAVAAAAF